MHYTVIPKLSAPPFFSIMTPPNCHSQILSHTFTKCHALQQIFFIQKAWRFKQLITYKFFRTTICLLPGLDSWRKYILLSAVCTTLGYAASGLLPQLLVYLCSLLPNSVPLHLQAPSTESLRREPVVPRAKCHVNTIQGPCSRYCDWWSSDSFSRRWTPWWHMVHCCISRAYFRRYSNICG